MNARALLRAILDQYELDPLGPHGLGHWARVCSNGLFLADREDADPELVELFALLHDACRLDDGRDEEHGLRGAQLATDFRGEYFELGDRSFESLHRALVLHSRGLLHDEPAVEVCWDADRLDLPRIGLQPLPGLLCTASARAVAEERDMLPEFGEEAFLAAHWGVDESGAPLDDDDWEDGP